MEAKLLLTVCLVAFCIFGVCQAGLKTNFYNSTCPSAEQIVRNVIWNRTASNPTLPAKLLRMHFHDCFVRGCDGSILLNSTQNNTAEKDAIPNQSLAFFEVIDEIKTQLENTCKGVVSCADILALAARDAVSFQFNKSMWAVPTGRRDGNISRISEAMSNLPPPSFNFTQLKQSFSGKRLSVRDLVVLSGGHTIGLGHCNFMSNRLYNFTGKGDQDPSLNSTYASFLKTKCNNLTDTSTLEMDPGSSQNFDNGYFVILQQNKGLFQSDAALLNNSASEHFAKKLVNTTLFFSEFAKSMKKMGAIGVLTGRAGEIRKQCSVIN